MNINQETHIIENKEEKINLNYSHQTNIKYTDLLTYKNTVVQYKTSYHILSTIYINKYYSSQRIDNSTRTCNITGSNNRIAIIDNNKGKIKIGIKYSNKKCIEVR